LKKPLQFTEKSFIPEEKNVRLLKVNLNKKDEEAKMKFLEKLKIISAVSKFIKSVVDETEINMAFNLYDMFG